MTTPGGGYVAQGGGGGWVTGEEAAGLRAAAHEFYRLDRLAQASLDYYAARLEAARMLAGRVEELVETLRQQRNQVDVETPTGGHS